MQLMRKKCGKEKVHIDVKLERFGAEMTYLDDCDMILTVEMGEDVEDIQMQILWTSPVCSHHNFKLNKELFQISKFQLRSNTFSNGKPNIRQIVS